MSSQADLKLFESELSDFRESQAHLDAKLATSQARLTQAFRHLDECCSEHASQIRQYNTLKRMLKQLRRAAKEEEEGGQGVDVQRLDQLEVEMKLLQKSLDRLRATKPRTGSTFLRLVIGRVNTKLWKQGDRLKFRDEYNKFKFKTTFIFILFPLVNVLLGVGPDSTLYKLHQLWVLYYYISLAMRENILLVNGSNIKTWWLLHHYTSCVIIVVNLLWPSLENRLIYDWLNYFAVTQGFVMALQQRYQSNRHYTRRAMGKAREVDVQSSETLVEKPTDLWLLIPLLFLIYAAEIWLGWLILTQVHSTSWNTTVLGSLFIVLGVGNVATTGSVLFEKRSARKMARRIQSSKKDP